MDAFIFPSLTVELIHKQSFLFIAVEINTTGRKQGDRISEGTNAAAVEEPRGCWEL